MVKIDTEKKSAFVAVVGRPSCGKSTLVNKLCGSKVSIVSAVPQTTRNSIRGIVNKEKGQLVFVDTPGRHNSEKKLNKKLIDTANRVQNEADIILYMIDASRRPGDEEKECIAQLPAILLKEKTVIAINKIDKKPLLRGSGEGNIQTFLNENLQDVPKNRRFLISGLEGRGVKELLDGIFDLAENGPQYYESDCYTDQDVSFRIGEIIRESATERLREELPHSIFVEIADCELSGETLNVRAFIRCERESQKGMIVGKGGTMIKKIRQASLAELRKIFDWDIVLDLRVKTALDWRHDDNILRKIF
ncbi:MAG: GTPase Era [Termitinemataceae bacterium]|nr:MAG: GTPase Era [Termitinemataceae bacterium]